MPRTTAEALRTGTFQVTQPRSLDLPKLYGNDYSRINERPDVLWKFWEKEKAILGPIVGTGDYPWYAAYPGVQYVNNHPESTHLVIAPRRDSFVSPSDLTIDDITPAVAFIQKFVETRDRHAYAGYNIGPEKDGSQMWWSWHIHLVKFGEGELTDLNKRPKIIWEPWPAHIEEVLEDTFVKKLLSMKGVPPAERVALSELDRFGFSSFGSSLLRFNADISAQELAIVMHQADRAYKQFHSGLKNTFFEQRGEEYVKKGSEAIHSSLERNDFSTQVVDHLATFGKEILPDRLPGTSSRNAPLTLPNYSAAILRDSYGTYFLFQPHIFRKKASALSSLGVYLDYTLDTGPQQRLDYEVKKARSTQLVNQLNTLLQIETSAA